MQNPISLVPTTTLPGWKFARLVPAGSLMVMVLELARLPEDGHTFSEGVDGSFSGNEHLFIIGGTFTAGNGTCNGHSSSDTANPCTTSSYVAYHYGSGASISVTSFVFNYKTTNALAIGKTWSETGNVNIFGGAEVDSGDIYTAP